jgi:hypothetical protein
MIQAIELKHTNPSLGPYEKIISYNLTNSEVHKAAFDKLLDGTIVNGQFDLKTYLTAYKNNDKETTDKIFKAGYKGNLRSGETISKLNITLIGGGTVQISDLRTTQMSGTYADFIRYLVKNGRKYESGGEDDFLLKKEEKFKGLNEIDDTDISI